MKPTFLFFSFLQKTQKSFNVPVKLKKNQELKKAMSKT